jgi:hypothetical protein
MFNLLCCAHAQYTNFEEERSKPLLLVHFHSRHDQTRSVTGCDSVTAFPFKGKVKALQLVMSSRSIQTTFNELGANWDPSEELLNALEEFVCCMERRTVHYTDIDEVRNHLFCRDLRSEELIPPTKDSLRQHSRRSNYQAAVLPQVADDNKRQEKKTSYPGSHFNSLFRLSSIFLF